MDFDAWGSGQDARIDHANAKHDQELNSEERRANLFAVIREREEVRLFSDDRTSMAGTQTLHLRKVNTLVPGHPSKEMRHVILQWFEKMKTARPMGPRRSD
jgi:hypothetical protein